MRTALAIFVKTPGVSPVKTRLAASIGKKNAEEFYINSLVVTAEIARDLQKKTSNLEIFWAIAEEESLNNEIWHDFRKIYQGSGDLGDRLGNVYKELKNQFDFVCFMGADSPHVLVKNLETGINKLQQGPKEKFVVGNTEDGGFYFFGGSLKIKKELWKSIKYSTNTTSSELCEKLTEFGFVEYISKSFDIDELTDLKKYKDIDLKSEELLERSLFLVDI